MFKRFFKSFFNRITRHDLQSLKSQIEVLQADVKSIREKQLQSDRVMQALKVGAHVSPRDGSWVVIAYRAGEKDYVNFYDFGSTNVGAIRDFLERFRKVGLNALVHTPFKRTKTRF